MKGASTTAAELSVPERVRVLLFCDAITSSSVRRDGRGYKGRPSEPVGLSLAVEMEIRPSRSYDLVVVPVPTKRKTTAPHQRLEC
jgi:hypothetical protein